MDRNSIYFKQVQLLIRCLPIIAEEPSFALKGGTAINLFIQDMPRLSVDIDLAYLPIENRDVSLANIHAALSRIAHDIEEKIPDTKVRTSDPQHDRLRLLVSAKHCQVKIELSPVLRGTVWLSETRGVCENVEDLFGYAEIKVVSEHDLYAGKICAALDRQHPRDLFDMKLFFEREGGSIDRDLIKTFLVYLISHPRPIAELLEPNRIDVSDMFESEFSSMTEMSVTQENLISTREELIAKINASLGEDDRKFLLSFKKKEPDWSLLDLPNIAELPAVKWKLLNIRRMSEQTHLRALQKLEAVLST